MKAVILAAGLGSRLSPVTQKTPKCLLEIGGKTIIERQLELLSSLGVKETVVVVGYLKEMIIDLIGDKVKIIENPDYSSTNSSYSLWLARKYLTGPFIHLNSDLLFDREILSKLIKSEYGNAMIVDESKNKADDMFKARLVKGKIVELSKFSTSFTTSTIAPGPIKFSSGTSDYLFTILRKLIENGKKNEWCYSLFSEISRDIDLYPINVNGLDWCEVDDSKDLAYAKSFKWEI